MLDIFLNLVADEEGAVTVDFVALTAAICLLGAVVVNAFSGEPVRMANNMSAFMEDQCSGSACD